MTVFSSFPSRLVLPVLVLLAGVPAAPSARGVPAVGVQNFLEKAPPDVFAGAFVMHGQVVHRAMDGSWIKLRAQSHRGGFSYLITRLGADSGELSGAPGTPEVPAGALAVRDTPWNRIQSSGPQSWLWLEGVITSTRVGGAEMEGRVAFSGEVVRLRLTLVENNPLGADPAPTFREVAYGPNARQRLDVYLAKSSGPTPVVVYIHGGGWQRGDKSDLVGQRVLLNAGISVIAINYRYIPAENPGPSIPAVAIPLTDAAKAVQFIRSKAAEWGLDKNRLGVWGISAGACSALWLATRSDLAEPSSPDLVLRESTRPSCISAVFPQTSLDPVEMRAWAGSGINYGPHAFAIRAGTAGASRFDAFLAARERLLPWINAYSPAALLSRESAPIFLDYLDFSLTPCEPLDAFYTHSPGFGVGFLARARQVGAECYLRYVGREDDHYRSWDQFLIAKLSR